MHEAFAHNELLGSILMDGELSSASTQNDMGGRRWRKIENEWWQNAQALLFTLTRSPVHQSKWSSLCAAGWLTKRKMEQFIHIYIDIKSNTSMHNLYSQQIMTPMTITSITAMIWIEGIGVDWMPTTLLLYERPFIFMCRPHEQVCLFTFWKIKNSFENIHADRE